MSEFIGFDEVLLGALRSSLRRAADELDELVRRCTDPNAAPFIGDASLAIRRARQSLRDLWLPAVERVLGITTVPMSWTDVDDPAIAAQQLVDDRVHGPLLAIAAEAILIRWQEGRPDGWMWPDQMADGPNVADRLFELLIADPAAATAFLRRAASDPPIVFFTAADETLVERLLAVGSSPEHTDAATAGAILLPMLSWARGAAPAFGRGHDGATPHARVYLAAAVAPWLAQFNRLRTDWGWTRHQADDTLVWIAREQAAMDRLLLELAAWQGRLETRPITRVDGTIDLGPLIDVATTISQLERACREADAMRGEASRRWLDLVLRAGGTVASALAPGGPVAGIATSGATKIASDLARTKLDEWGVVPSAARVEAEAQERFGGRVSHTAIVAITAIVCQQALAGTLPASAIDDLGRALDVDDDGDCATDAVATRLEGYVEGLRLQTDPATFNAMSAVLLAFANPDAVAEACE